MASWQGKDDLTLLSDNLRAKYASIADDSSKSEKKREAAMLMSAAEGDLADDPDLALQKAQNAVDIFKSIGDAAGIADSVRLEVHATRAVALVAKADGEASQMEKLLQNVEAKAKDQLSSFRESDDKMGQARMLLAVAEANVSLVGNDRKREAMDCAEEADELADELGDVKLQALVAQDKAIIFQARHHFKAAAKAAKEATNLFNKISDTKKEGSAWYALGAAEINSGRTEEGMRCKAKAMKLWKDSGEKSLEAAALCSVAQWCLVEKEDTVETIKAAKEAVTIYKETKNAPGLALAYFWLVEGYIANGDVDKALDLCKERLELAQEGNDKKELCDALQRLAIARVSNKDTDDAMLNANEAVDASADVNDKRWHARSLEVTAAVYQAQDEMSSAKEKMNEAIEIMQGLKGYEEETVILMQSLARLQMDNSEYKDAGKTMESARAVALKADDRYLEGICVLGASSAHALAGDMKKAMAAATLAQELFGEEGHRRGEGRALMAMSEFSAATGDLNGAVKAANEGTSLMQDFGDMKLAASLKASLSSANMMNGKAPEAAKAAMEALKLARMESDSRLTVEMLFLVLDTNNSILMESAEDEKQIKAFKTGCEKSLRLAKEAVGLAVKMRDPGTEGAANFWVGHLNLMIGEVKEALAAASKAKGLSVQAKDANMEVRLLVLSAHCHLANADQSAATTALNDALAVDGADSEGKSMAQRLLDSIVGSQQQMQMMPMMMQQQMMAGGDGGAGAASAGGGEVEVYKPPDPMQVRQYIMNLVQNMTGSSDEIDGDTPLMESGIDSLASVELRTQLQQEFRLNLPSTVMFNYPTISAMTGLLVGECTQKKISWGR